MRYWRFRRTLLAGFRSVFNKRRIGEAMYRKYSFRPTLDLLERRDVPSSAHHALVATAAPVVQVAHTEAAEKDFLECLFGCPRPPKPPKSTPVTKGPVKASFQEYQLGNDEAVHFTAKATSAKLSLTPANLKTVDKAAEGLADKDSGNNSDRWDGKSLLWSLGKNKTLFLIWRNTSRTWDVEDDQTRGWLAIQPKKGSKDFNVLTSDARKYTSVNGKPTVRTFEANGAKIKITLDNPRGGSDSSLYYSFGPKGDHAKASGSGLSLVGPNQQTATPIAGSWAGTYTNSLGNNGNTKLQLSEDGSGNLTGTWDDVNVTGKRTGSSTFQFSGKTTTISYEVNATINNGTMTLNYTATRLTTSGSYTGSATLSRA
jgi:hypothetical protein